MDVIVTMCVQVMVYANWENEVVKNLFVGKLLLAEAPPEVLCKKKKLPVLQENTCVGDSLIKRGSNASVFLWNLGKF